ncbi:hypothetical protein EXN66_Car015223 [Channa argus]|uniref:Uncharacterized protein n=1 Tax=Channa argus TaxID=215402 RepID=A0A6G1QBL2_CHAAH|nr:hypothetical protein EXN66_Car015223 [Channa argus]
MNVAMVEIHVKSIPKQVQHKSINLPLEDSLTVHAQQMQLVMKAMPRKNYIDKKSWSLQQTLHYRP